MRIVIIVDTQEKFDQIALTKEDIEIEFLQDYVEEVPAAWGNYEKEYLPHVISERIDLEEKIILIEFSTDVCDKYLLAHHLVLKTGSPVIFFSDAPDEIDFFSEIDYGLFRSKAATLIGIDKLDDQEELELKFKKIKREFDSSNHVDQYLRNLILDKHQATNEWGAIKLLLNHGLTLDEIDKSYIIPRTVFFKIKLLQHGISPTKKIDNSSSAYSHDISKAKSEFTRNLTNLNKILLIDDNATKGWSYFFNEFFSGAIVEEESYFDNVFPRTDLDQYDMIFLDLRLPKNEKDNKVELEYGLNLVEHIKSNERFLHLPLIVFSASEKASTLNAILERGADDMYVKESPDLTQEGSIENYLDFISKINFQIKKYNELKSYWNAILTIKSSFLPEITDTPNSLLRSRIVERLEMFYGLIKKKYEQTIYDESRFHFSSEVLGFITLWSILNEIQECYFEKGMGKSYVSLKDNTPSGSRVTYSQLDLDEWKIKGQRPERYYIRENPIIKENIDAGGRRTRPNRGYIQMKQYSEISIRYHSPFFEWNSSGFQECKVNYKDKLSLQIAFLVLGKTTLNTSSKINQYLEILHESNTQRNKLYVTHGEDLNSGFYSREERRKTLAPNVTFDLFKLVSFLLTGDDTIV